MPDNSTTELAEQFVAFALRYSEEQWLKRTSVPIGGRKFLLQFVRAAGFNAKAVVSGKLRGNVLEQDGDRTGDTFAINHLSPFKVVDEDGDDNYRATGWLDCALRLVVYETALKGRTRADLAKEIAKEIERSVPLAPIQLTSLGDLLGEYPPGTNYFGLAYFVDHTRDDKKLSSCVGVHQYCGGWMDRREATATHDVITCRACHLRVPFPKSVQTYGDLRQALAPVREVATA